MPNSPNIIAITGTTATGKTSKALEIAEQNLQEKKGYKVNGEARQGESRSERGWPGPEGALGYEKVIIISADSKQIYSELPILTGADIPSDWEKLSAEESTCKAIAPFFKHPTLNIELHGVGVLAGGGNWGAGNFAKLAGSLFKNSNNSTLFIVVGGTGFYHQQLFYPSRSMSFDFEPDEKLRAELATQGLEKLQAQLKELWPERLENMNHSDKNNSRRLIRAIEIATAEPQTSQLNLKPKKTTYPHQKISMMAKPEELEQKISQRIHDRIQDGAIEEVQKFEKRYSFADLRAKESLGYQEILKFINQEISLEELKKNWLTKELQYAKRQITWWQKYL